MPLRYVALGDSYTIGTAIDAAGRWPNQLVARLPALDLVANLGVDGFTSRDVIQGELPGLDRLRPEVLSVLVGVNDVVQGVLETTYRANVAIILDAMVRHVGASRAFLVTTPDYTVTPSGAAFGDPTQQSAGIAANNAIITAEAATRGITVIDIFDLSLRAATDRSLVADDGLHPGAAQYATWVDRIEPVVRRLVGG
ncbi:MAG TPA: SGNH/GDSL hydrolase family protein [Candidatus Limnocylindrales bacterium]|jgi:lysophospholipase L1-like esterase